MRASGTKRPPYRPKWPVRSGTTAVMGMTPIRDEWTDVAGAAPTRSGSVQAQRVRRRRHRPLSTLVGPMPSTLPAPAIPLAVPRPALPRRRPTVSDVHRALEERLEHDDGLG